MPEDKMEVTILEDGSYKIETDRISAPNHGNAELLVKKLVEAAGGAVRRERKHDPKGHHHTHRHH